jgi:hypothetical protein
LVAGELVHGGLDVGISSRVAAMCHLESWWWCWIAWLQGG